MKTLATGRVRDKGKMWFEELSDRREYYPLMLLTNLIIPHFCVCLVIGASTKRHVYWAMKNCGGDAEVLKRLIENVVSHYKDIHSNCHATSLCKHQTYTPDKAIITSDQAAQVYLDALKSLAVYKQADSYARVSYEVPKYLCVSTSLQRYLLAVP
jgi:hypothetical protein